MLNSGGYEPHILFDHIPAEILLKFYYGEDNTRESDNLVLELSQMLPSCMTWLLNSPYNKGNELVRPSC